MSQPFITQEVSIVIAVRQSPTVIQEQFLRLSGIIPDTWQLTKPAITTEQLSQLIFDNGCSITAQPDRTMFLEQLGEKNPDQVQIGAVARKFVQTLKAADYQAVGINFRGYVPYPDAPNAADHYLSQQLLAPGDWQSFGTAPMRAALNLLYTTEHGQLTLSINSATLQQERQPELPILLFSGNFNYELQTVNPDKRLQTMAMIIENWITNYDTFQDLITEKFLKSMGES